MKEIFCSYSDFCEQMERTQSHFKTLHKFNNILNCNLYSAVQPKFCKNCNAFGDDLKSGEIKILIELHSQDIDIPLPKRSNENGIFKNNYYSMRACWIWSDR